MAYSQTIVISCTASNPSVKNSQTVTCSGTNENNLVETVPGDGNPHTYTPAGFTVASLVNCSFQCTGDLSIVPKDGTGTSGTTITLAAGGGLVWYAASGVSCPIVGITNVATFVVTSTAGGIFQFLSLKNG